MTDLLKISLVDLVRLSARLRASGVQSATMEEAARGMVDELYTTLLRDGAQGGRACALVRFYKTHKLRSLDERRKQFVNTRGGGDLPPNTPCLTLLATRGDEDAWNDVLLSTGHLAIPLRNREAVTELPMVARLVQQLGVDLGPIFDNDGTLVFQDAQRTCNVFHVAEAHGSPYVPAQASFVEKYGIQSVIGFGGVLPTGDFFAIIMFTKVHISPAVADLFKTLALAARVAMLSLGRRVFMEGGASSAEPELALELAYARAEVEALRELLAEEDRAVFEQAKLLEDNARRFESQFRVLRATFDSITDGVALYDNKGQFWFSNAATTRISGYAAEEVGAAAPNQRAAMLGYHRPDQTTLLTYAEMPLRRVFLGETVDEMEIFVRNARRPEGRWVVASAALVKNDDGSIAGAVTTQHDITDRKRFEEELVQAREAAEAGSRAKSEFLASMSHEIRTPMNGVVGMTGLLLDTQLTTEQRDFVETIRTSGDALLTIINDILDFSKIEAGQIDLENHPFDIRQCVEDALDLVSHGAIVKGLELAVYVAPDVPARFLGDVTRLRQVLVNLLSNAVKFTEKGEVIGEIALDETVDSRNFERGVALRIQVRDTGIGIPQDRLSKLFRSFSQVDSSISRRFGGTGLGLAICRRLVELMGGTIGVESTVGAGSTFQVKLELEMVTEPDDAQALRSAVFRLNGIRVLLVDDNATNRRILALQCQAWGMVPVVASSAAEALEILAHDSNFPLAILDAAMPEMTGVELVEKIVNDPRLQRMTLIMLTSTIDSSTKRAAEALGVAFYLYKPVKQSQLFEALLAALSGNALATRRLFKNTPLDGSLGKRIPLRILLAEDNVINQKVGVLMLAKLGYRVDVAANGIEVLKITSERAYDVILMDLQMPEMDGIEASRRLRVLGALAYRPRIVAVTANVMQSDRDMCVAAGMDEFISKPMNIEDLVAALVRAGSAIGMASYSAPSERVPKVGEQAESIGAALVHIDHEALDKLRFLVDDDEPAAFARLISEHVDNARALLTTLQVSLASGVIEETRRAAHSLKSSSAMFGLREVSRCAAELEAAAKQGDERAMHELAHILINECKTGHGALLQIR